jgi:protein SCO1/2
VRARRLAEAALLAAALAAPPVLGPAAASPAGPARQTVTGLVLEVAPSRERFVVSHDAIGDQMGAMTMGFDVRDRKALDGVAVGARVRFTLVIDRDGAHAEAIEVLRDENAHQDPVTARRLRLLADLVAPSGAAPALAPGEEVPDFRLVDQHGRPVRLSQFRGRVVAINFVYTNCALPQFCLRLANQFSALQTRLRPALARDLTLLTITFDPARDRPEVLRAYARRELRVSTDAWRFLTGDVGDVRRVCRTFGVDAFADEGLMNHSTHTVVIDRRGRLVANVEGNQLSTRQVGDLIESVLRRPGP